MHPDLVERLVVAAGPLGSSCRTELHGTPVLAAATGVVFAFVWSRSTLALRLPERLHGWAMELGASPCPDFGPEWLTLDPWDPDLPTRQHLGDLGYWIEAAQDDAARVTA